MKKRKLPTEKAPVKKKKPNEVLVLAKRLRQLREKTGKSQEKFAYEHGYTLSHYSRMERGEDVRFSSLVRLCKALDMDLKAFFSAGFEDI